jgi:ferredoxin-NADP reductase
MPRSVDLGSNADILFIHNARTPADIIFRQELDAVAAITPNIRVVRSDCLFGLLPELAVCDIPHSKNQRVKRPA